MATNSPLWMLKSRPLRMSMVREPLRMDLRNPVTSIMGCVLPASLLTGLRSPFCAE